MGFNRDWFALAHLHIIADPSAALTRSDFEKAAETAGKMGAIKIGEATLLPDVLDLTSQEAGVRKGFTFHTEIERNACLAALNGLPAPKASNTRATLFGR